MQAYYAQITKSYGAITALANEYNICRQFVYNLLYQFQLISIFFFPMQTQLIYKSKKEIISTILSLRMEGGSSIQAISTVMRRLGFEKYSSVGYISETLSQIGGLLNNTVQAIIIQRIILGSDEIFAKRRPILIDVEPISSVIIKIELAKDRTGETWSEHYNGIVENNFDIKQVNSDGGTGLLLGLKESSIEANWQPDTFHAVSHRLGDFVRRFKSKAYSAISCEYDRELSSLKSKTDETFEKKYKRYIEASNSAVEAIELYDNFTFLYHCIITQLRVFRSNGKLRDKNEAIWDIEAGLELLDSLNNEEISKEVKSIRKILPELLNYFEEAKQSIYICKSFGISDKALKILSLLWQGEKDVIKAKNKYRRTKAKQQKEKLFQEAKYLLGDEFEIMKSKVFAELDNVIQASSIVENINSILRPYLDRSKNQVTQEFLNLFAFYHNNRVYNDGKRKGKTPMEILTKQKQSKDWIELLIDTIEEVEPTFFL